MKVTLVSVIMGLCFPLLCQAEVVVPVREEALTKPSKHAWDLFLALNHPAKDPSIERGVPDPTKKVGDEGIVVWETWKLARTEVFLEDGSEPPPWNDNSKEGAPTKPKSFDLPKAALIRALSKGIDLDEAHSLTPMNIKKLLVDPEDGVFTIGGGETRMNRANFEFIAHRDNQLYNVEGQEKLYSDIVSGRRPTLSFPLDSIEVKAMWIPLSDADITSGKAARYHKGKDYQGNLYGLVALHIITKDVPNWFWCSFRQTDGPTPYVPSVDSFGRPQSLNGTKWAFYELSGTQTDFTDPTGRAVLLSDPHVEAGFERSSCISCHAMASIGAPSSAPRGDRPRFFFTERTSPEIPLRDQFPPHAFVGTPDPSIFFDSRGRKRYVQLDFLFSMHFRANRKRPVP